MKISYLSYLSLISQKPEATLNIKIIPGDLVEVCDDFKEFIDAKDIIKQTEPKDQKVLEELGRERVAEKRTKKAVETPKKAVTKEEVKKEPVLELSDIGSKMVDYKMELKKEGRSKSEIKRMVTLHKKKLEDGEKETKKAVEISKKAVTKEEVKKAVEISKKAVTKEEVKRIVKDPKTGEIKKV